MNKNVIKNYIYNFSFQFFRLLAPLLVTPYVARIFGEDGTGQYSFSYSIVTYFILIAGLGFTTYAQRLIASHQGNRKQQSIDFWEIVISRFIPSVITLIVYFSTIVVGMFDEKYIKLLSIFSIEIIGVMFDVSFFFQGNEEFKKTAVASILVKIISYIFIFVFIKNESDLWKYVLILSLADFFSNSILWIYIPNYIEKVKFKELKVLKHIPATFILFLPTIATSVYTSLDKTLIGIITKNDAENGNYEYAEKIVKMALTFVTSLGTVLIPKNSKMVADGDTIGIKNNINKSIEFVFFLGVPLMFGCIVISDVFIPWFLGPGYSKAAFLMRLLSPIILIIGLSNVFGLQFLIPNNQDKKFTFCVTLGAIINFLFNIFLIPRFASYGAAIATLIGESSITVSMLSFIYKDIDFCAQIKKTWKNWIAGLVMFILCLSISKLKYFVEPLNILLIIVIGFFIYAAVLYVLRDSFLLEIITFIKYNINAFLDNQK